MLQQLRITLRQLAKRPAFTLAAIGTLAVGIGATTAIFSTVNATILRPLPFPDPGLRNPGPAADVHSDLPITRYIYLVIIEIAISKVTWYIYHVTVNHSS